MQKIYLILCIAGLTIFASACSKSAVCDCSIIENDVLVESPVYHSAGNDPTCNDFEYQETEDSITTVVTCVAR